MTDVERLQAAVRDELVAVRPRGVERLNDPDLRGKIDTKNLETATREVSGYVENMTRVAAIFLLLEREVPRVAQPHRKWLEVMFKLPENLRGRDAGELRDELAEEVGVTKNKFNRKGGLADQAITSLAAQIVADCFRKPSRKDDESSDDDGEPELLMPEPAKESSPVKRWYIAVGLVVVAALTTATILFFSDSNGDHAASDQPSAQELEARYDGKDPRGLDGAKSRCADPPPSQPVPASTPPVYGPGGQQVGNIELRTSSICPVIWARVLWNGDPDATYQIPPGWTLHVVAHRPETKTVMDYPESSRPGPIPYGLGSMLTTLRGCVFVEAYFTNGNQKTQAVPTSCVKADVSK